MGSPISREPRDREQLFAVELEVTRASLASGRPVVRGPESLRAIVRRSLRSLGPRSNARAAARPASCGFREGIEVDSVPEFVLALPKGPDGYADDLDHVVIAGADYFWWRAAQRELPRDAHGPLRDVRGQHGFAR